MRRYVLGNTQSEYLYINYMSFDSIFYLHNVVGGGVQMHKRHIWREDIVVPYVTTYAVPLRTRTYAYTIVKTKNLYTISSSICCLKKTGF